MSLADLVLPRQTNSIVETRSVLFYVQVMKLVVLLFCQVLYQSLPLMLESCADQHEDEPAILNSSPKPIVIGQAVEFLQALLDMMTEQNIHLEVRLLPELKLGQLAVTQ